MGKALAFPHSDFAIWPMLEVVQGEQGRKFVISLKENPNLSILALHSLLRCLRSTSSFFLFFKDFIHLFMRDTQREAETQAAGEAGSMWGALGSPP